MADQDTPIAFDTFVRDATVSVALALLTGVTAALLLPPMVGGEWAFLVRGGVVVLISFSVLMVSWSATVLLTMERMTS